MQQVTKNSCRRDVRLAAVAASVLMLACLTPARGTEQQLGLSVPRREIVRLAEPPQNGRVYDLTFSPRGDSLVCAFALEQAVQVWDVTAKPRLITTLTPPAPDELLREDAKAAPHPIAFSSDGARLAIATDYRGIQIWDVAQCKPLFGVSVRWEPAVVQFSPTHGNLVVGCRYDGAYKIDGEFPSKVEVVPREAYERVRVNDSKGFDIHDGHSPRGRIPADPPEKNNVYCLAIYPDGKRFATGGGRVFVDADGRFRTESSVTTVWELPTGRRIFEIGSEESPIRRFCLSPDGRTLYSCGDKVLGWDATKPGTPLREFDAHGGRMLSVAISPDGAMLVAGGQDGTVVVWDIKAAKRLGTLTHAFGPVYGLAFSPTSAKLVAVGEQGVATVWTVELHSAKKEKAR
jgi:WD40 repeat protein